MGADFYTRAPYMSAFELFDELIQSYPIISILNEEMWAYMAMERRADAKTVTF